MKQWDDMPKKYYDLTSTANVDGALINYFLILYFNYLFYLFLPDYIKIFIYSFNIEEILAYYYNNVNLENILYIDLLHHYLLIILSIF